MGLFSRRNSGAVLKVQEASYNWDTEDPFSFAVYHRDNYPPGGDLQAPPEEEANARQRGNDYTKFLGYRMYKGTVTPGFPLHSHWGYECITYVSEGYIDHFDSLGNQGRFGYGDMQWTTASSRFSHCEMYPLAYPDRDNIQVVAQICINLPLDRKNRENSVRTIWGDDLGKASGDGWSAVVLVGEFEGARGAEPGPLSWASDPSHHVRIVRISIEKGGSIVLQPTDAASRNIYVTESDAVVDGRSIHRMSRVKLRTDAQVQITMERSGSDIWLLEGDPIGETQRSYGPVVLGTDREVRDALNEIRAKQESEWRWRFVNQKQPLGTRRFFQDADGNRSEPPGPGPGEHELPPLRNSDDDGHRRCARRRDRRRGPPAPAFAPARNIVIIRRNRKPR